MRSGMRSRCGSRSADGVVVEPHRRATGSALSSGSCRLGGPSPRSGSGRLQRVGRDWVATHPRRPILRWRCPPSRHPDGAARTNVRNALLVGRQRFLAARSRVPRRAACLMRLFRGEDGAGSGTPPGDARRRHGVVAPAPRTTVARGGNECGSDNRTAD
jgi:hypothetical protein